MGSGNTCSIRNVLTIVIIMAASKGKLAQATNALPGTHYPFLLLLSPSHREGRGPEVVTAKPSTHHSTHEGATWGDKRVVGEYSPALRVLPRLLPRGWTYPQTGHPALSPISVRGSAFTIKLEAPSLGLNGPCADLTLFPFSKSGDNGHPWGHLSHRGLPEALGMVPMGQCLTNSFISCSSQGSGNPVLVLSLSAPLLETSALTKTVAQDGKPVPFQG